MREPVIYSATLSAASDYAQRGWPVIPVYGVVDGHCACGGDPACKPGKHPLGRLAPHGLRDATTDAATIRAWWDTWPDANVAIATGVSGFDVLDVDPAHGGLESLTVLEQRHGALPPTLTVRTGSGGSHRFFAHRDGVRNTVKLDGLDGLDVRGQGGYVVAPPSLHVSGQRYEWMERAPIAPWPDALLPLVARNGHVARTPVRDENTAVIVEGERNARLTTLGGALQHAGAAPAAIETALLAINQHNCVPPLDEAEVRRIAVSVRRYPADVPRPRLTLRRARDVEAPPVEWQIEPLIAAGMLSILSGRDGLGKTLLALEFARATLLGVPLLHRFPARQGAVIALLLDDPPNLVIERLERMSVRDHGALWLATPDDLDLSDPIGMLAELEAHAIERHARLVIVDALFNLMPTSADAGNDAARMRPVLDALNALAQRTGAAVLLIAHDRKDGGDVAGSYAIRAAAKVILRLLLPKGADADADEGPTTPERVLQLNKSKLTVGTAYRLRLEGPGRWELHGTQREHRAREHADERANLRTAVLSALDVLAEATVDAIAEVAGRRPADVRALLSELVTAPPHELQRRSAPPEPGHRGRPRVLYRRRDGNPSCEPHGTEIPA